MDEKIAIFIGENELKSEWEEIKKAKNLKIEEPNWDDFR